MEIKVDLSRQTDSIVTQFCYNNTYHEHSKALLSRKQPILVGELVISEKYADKQLEGLRNILNLIIEELKIGFVSGNNKNPLKNVFYYDKKNKRGIPFHIDISSSSFIIPEKFQERILRVYRARDSSEEEAQEFWQEMKNQYK